MSTLFSNPNPFAQSQSQPQQQPQQQQQQQQQQQTPNLFSNTIQTSQPQSGSLFGSTTQNNQPQRPSLFTNTSNTAPPNQSGSLFGGSLIQPQQQNLGGPALGTSTFGGNTLNNQSQSLQQSQARPLWQPSSYHPREKTIPDQILTLRKKWHSDSPDCAFQKYFYNHVGVENAMYYVPNPGEDEAKWEDALAKKPSADVVPSLYRGFNKLSERVKGQALAVQGLNARLHEINDSLTAQQQQHELDVSVRAAEAKRRHVALSQRCLRLAAKVQVLRNRGYVMDTAEEDLRRKLSELERSTFDPSLSSRREEIWARMVGIRERTKMLQAETERAGNGLGEQQEMGLDEEILSRAKKILNDYDSQISHLKRETDAIRKDLAEWEEGNGSLRNGN